MQPSFRWMFCVVVVFAVTIVGVIIVGAFFCQTSKLFCYLFVLQLVFEFEPRFFLNFLGDFFPPALHSKVCIRGKTSMERRRFVLLRSFRLVFFRKLPASATSKAPYFPRCSSSLRSSLPQVRCFAGSLKSTIFNIFLFIWNPGKANSVVRRDERCLLLV